MAQGLERRLPVVIRTRRSRDGGVPVLTALTDLCSAWCMPCRVPIQKDLSAQRLGVGLWRPWERSSPATLYNHLCKLQERLWHQPRSGAAEGIVYARPDRDFGQRAI